VKSIRTQIEEVTSDYDKEKLQERVASSPAALRSSRLALDRNRDEERKARVETRACDRAVVEEGIVAGGELPTSAPQCAGQDQGRNPDQEGGIKIVRRALE